LRSSYGILPYNANLLRNNPVQGIITFFVRTKKVNKKNRPLTTQPPVTDSKSKFTQTRFAQTVGEFERFLTLRVPGLRVVKRDFAAPHFSPGSKNDQVKR
jgi:hypothetical protein